MLDLHRNWFKWLEYLAGGVFARFPLAPNHYTSISILMALGMFYGLIGGNYLLTIVFFFLAGGLDFVDGAVARRKGLSTARGAYWDTIADRYVEGLFLLGLLFVKLPEWVLPSYGWIFLVLFGAIMTTYAKAAAKEKGLFDTELKGGLMSRGERFICYLLVLVLFYFKLQLSALYLLVLLAVLTNITAGQRIAMALNKNK